MKRVEIRHTTRYDFGTPVRLDDHRLLLRPREGHDLRIVTSALDILPEATLIWRRDFYDNVLAVASFPATRVANLVIESRVQVELYETMPLNFVVEDHALYCPPDYTASERMALSPYLAPMYQDHPTLTNWLTPYRTQGKRAETFAVLDGLNRRINDELDYVVREEPGVLSPVATLSRGSGSCRDMAALFMECCRRLGIAARFVSGYIHGPATEAGGASTHAWAEVYLPGGGWKGFDPTNLAVVGPDHIRVCVHHHPEAVPPVAGSFIGPADLTPAMLVDVEIHQLAEA